MPDLRNLSKVNNANAFLKVMDSVVNVGNTGTSV